jgi:cbb3-type cytochrome oxidase subunit 3
MCVKASHVSSIWQPSLESKMDLAKQLLLTLMFIVLILIAEFLTRTQSNGIKDNRKILWYNDDNKYGL